MSSLSGYTIAFDLDGTLVDSAPDIHRTLNHIMSELGLPPASAADVRNFVGHGSRGLIVRACAVHGVINTDSRLDELSDLFRDYYGADIARATRPFPGVESCLRALQAGGALLCVCTNKHTDLAVKLLAALNLSPWFAAVVGADHVARRKPHPDHFIAAVRAAQGDPSRAMMVGDSASDVGAGRGANAPVAVYAHGYTDTAPELLGADAVFSHFDELPGLAARLLLAQPMPRV
jgi:phosphoglycolate phosphatase